MDEYELGPDVPDAVTKLNTEGTLYLKRGAYGKSADSFRRALAAVESGRDD